MPVPQVKVGPDGQIIVDEATTVIDTTQAKKAQKDLLNSTLVFESSNKATNYGSWGKKRKNVDWSDRYYTDISQTRKNFLGVGHSKHPKMKTDFKHWRYSFLRHLYSITNEMFSKIFT